MEQAEFNFKVTGNILMDVSAEPVLDAQDRIIGFETKQGTVRLCVCLEVEKPDGTFEYLPTEVGMEKVGATLVDYNDADFVKIIEDEEV